MKTILCLVTMVGAAFLLIIFYERASIMKTVWDTKVSALWFDIMLFLLGLNLAVVRGISAFKKLFGC